MSIVHASVPAVAVEGAPKPRAPRASSDLPPKLAGFSFDYKDNLLCAEETDEGAQNRKTSTGTGEVHTAAQFVVFRPGKPNEEKFDLKTLNSGQIRKLAQNFGCKTVGSATKFGCRVEMAKRKLMGTAYNNLDIPNATASTHALKVNTMLRLINTCFHPEFIQRFLEINDGKKRKDHEQAPGGGGSPVKIFWRDVSDYFNDSLNNDELSMLLYSGADEDEYLHKQKVETNINLNDFNQQTHLTCAKHIMDLMRCRAKIQKNIGKSGNHSSDPSDYLHPENLRPGNKKTSVPGVPIVYIFKRAKEYNAIDAAFATVIHDYLKSCSMSNADLDVDDETLTTASSRSKNDEFIAEFNAARAEMIEQQNKANAQRAALIQMQQLSLAETTKHANEEAQRAAWKEFVMLSKTVSELRKDTTGVNALALKSVARRVRAVEKQLDIPDDESIVLGV